MSCGKVLPEKTLSCKEHYDAGDNLAKDEKEALSRKIALQGKRVVNMQMNNWKTI